MMAEAAAIVNALPGGIWGLTVLLCGAGFGLWLAVWLWLRGRPVGDEWTEEIMSERTR